MAFLDDARRWVRDRLSNDEYINGTPKEHLRTMLAALPSMSQKERQHSLGHLTAYSEYYFRHHGESIPADMRQHLTSAAKHIERLDAVDRAREVLKQYGGPPSRHTISDSLERSAKELLQQQKIDRPVHRVKEQPTIKQSLAAKVGL